MNFLKTILNDLDTQNISYEEHYDPGGMELYVMHVRNHANPSLIFSKHNPSQVLLSIFITYSPPHLSNLEDDEKFRRELILIELAQRIGLEHKIGIQMDVFHASIGIIFDFADYNIHKFLGGIIVVINAYDKFIRKAVEILNRD
jgi:hypothetical protein